MLRGSGRFKMILVVLGVLIVALSGGMGYITHGLGETEGLVINEVDFSSIPDGVYQGEFKGHRWSNKVEVVVEGGRAKDIQMVERQRFHLDRPVEEIIARIIEQQSLPVDVVTGATATSKAIMKSVENALKDR